MCAYGDFRRQQPSKSQAAARSQPRPPQLKPTLPQVLKATRSLYQDEIRPYGRILLKRIREQCATRRFVKGRGPIGSSYQPDTNTIPTESELNEVGMIDPKFLRRLCEGCSELLVEPTEGKEYSVTLVGQPRTFVDPCSPKDTYPRRLWAQAATYFESLEEEDGCFPGGRYACAQVLKSRSLPFLMTRSLGEICHIVQLAISQRKLLGYLEGYLVPYWRSEECLKEKAAERQQPVSNPSQQQQQEEQFATWEDVYQCLKALLQSSSNPAPKMISLSNVKRLFRSNYNLALSETVLGYPRVQEMLQDPRLSGLCHLDTLGNGQTVIRLIESWQPPSQPMSPESSWFQADPYYGRMEASTSLPFQMQQSPSHQVDPYYALMQACASLPVQMQQHQVDPYYAPVQMQQSTSHQVYYGEDDAWRCELSMMANFSAAGSQFPSPAASPYEGSAYCASSRHPTQQWGGVAAAPIPLSLLTTVPQSTRLATYAEYSGSRGAMPIAQQQEHPQPQQPQPQQPQPQQPQPQPQPEQQQEHKLLQLPVLAHQTHHQEPMGWWQNEEDDAALLQAALVEADIKASNSDVVRVEDHQPLHEHAGVPKERKGSDTHSLQSLNSTLTASTLVTPTPSEAEVEFPVRQEVSLPTPAPADAADEVGCIVRNTFWHFSPKARRQGRKRSSSVPCSVSSA